MKKLKMIVTSVVVLAIVGSAFAFKVKAGAFCVLASSASGDNCTTFIQDKKIDPFGALQFKYYPAWDGDKATCTAANNHLCTASILTLSQD